MARKRNGFIPAPGGVHLACLLPWAEQPAGGSEYRITKSQYQILSLDLIGN
jgi:hypothetical protein